MTLNIAYPDGKHKVETDGIFEIEGELFFAHESLDPNIDSEWRVSELKSGYAVGYGETRNRAIRNAETRIKEFGVEKLKERITANIEKTGIANEIPLA